MDDPGVRNTPPLIGCQPTHKGVRQMPGAKPKGNTHQSTTGVGAEAKILSDSCRIGTSTNQTELRLLVLSIQPLHLGRDITDAHGGLVPLAPRSRALRSHSLIFRGCFSKKIGDEEGARSDCPKTCLSSNCQAMLAKQTGV